MIGRGFVWVCVFWAAGACGGKSADNSAIDANSKEGAGGLDGVGGAGAGSPEPESEKLCDGSDSLRFAMTYTPGEPNANGARFQTELGFRFLYINGKCQYWVQTHAEPGRGWNPVRAGFLVGEDAYSIEVTFSYADWGALAGLYGTPAGNTSYTVLHNGVDVIAFDGFVVGESPAVSSMYRAAESFATSLYARGTDFTGPLRLIAFSPVLDRTPSSVEAIPSPLATPLEDIALALDERYSPGTSLLVTDAAETAALRDARRRFIAGELGSADADMIVATSASSDERFFLSFRDSIPVEDSNGLVPVPGAP